MAGKNVQRQKGKKDLLAGMDQTEAIQITNKYKKEAMWRKDRYAECKGNNREGI